VSNLRSTGQLMLTAGRFYSGFLHCPVANRFSSARAAYVFGDTSAPLVTLCAGIRRRERWKVQDRTLMDRKDCMENDGRDVVRRLAVLRRRSLVVQSTAKADELPSNGPRSSARK